MCQEVGSTIFNIFIPIIGIFASIGAIVFLIHRLFSEPYSLKIDLPNPHRDNSFYLIITNTTGYSLETNFDIDTHILCQDNKKYHDFLHGGNNILSPNVEYKVRLDSLTEISDTKGLEDSRFINHQLKLDINIYFKNSRWCVQKFKKNIRTKWLYNPHTQSFFRIK